MDTPTQTDIQITHYCSLALVQPLTARGRRWLATNTTDDATWFHGALHVETRYLSPLVNGMTDAGLQVAR